jgi:hypothetical protein
MLQALFCLTRLNRSQQGSLEWRMHDSQTIAGVAWRDKKTVHLLSTHARPVVVEGEERPTVPRCNGAVRETVPISSVHLEYTTHMRGVMSLTNFEVITHAKKELINGGIEFSISFWTCLWSICT